MVAQALLIWLVTYVSFLALFGFLLFVGRSFSGRRAATLTVVRMASLLAFVAATAFWVLVVLVD